MQLVIGNKNYSSWSMRAWMALRCFDFDFQEIRVPLFSPGYKEKLASFSASARVPVLVDGDTTVNDSLAICEYLAELNASMWPHDKALRAKARAVTAEMHSSFFNIRDHLPMNCRQSRTLDSVSEDLQKEIDRMFTIWRDCLTNSAGGYLCGDLSIADIFYSPVVSRFTTYEISIPDDLKGYMDTIQSLAAYQQWHAEAAEEPETIDVVDNLSGVSLR